MHINIRIEFEDEDALRRAMDEIVDRSAALEKEGKQVSKVNDKLCARHRSTARILDRIADAIDGAKVEGRK